MHTCGTRTFESRPYRSQLIVISGIKRDLFLTEVPSLQDNSANGSADVGAAAAVRLTAFCSHMVSVVGQHASGRACYVVAGRVGRVK